MFILGVGIAYKIGLSSEIFSWCVWIVNPSSLLCRNRAGHWFLYPVLSLVDTTYRMDLN
jgi:hypothetical protein